VMIRQAIAAKAQAVDCGDGTYHGADVTISGAVLESAGVPCAEEYRCAWLVLITPRYGRRCGNRAETRSAFNYAGQKIEEQPVIPLFDSAASPLYVGAAGCVAKNGRRRKNGCDNSRLVPGQFDRPAGCLFSPRCKSPTPNAKPKHRPFGPDLGYGALLLPLEHRTKVAS